MHGRRPRRSSPVPRASHDPASSPCRPTSTRATPASRRSRPRPRHGRYRHTCGRPPPRVPDRWYTTSAQRGSGPLRRLWSSGPSSDPVFCSSFSSYCIFVKLFGIRDFGGSRFRGYGGTRVRGYENSFHVHFSARSLSSYLRTFVPPYLRKTVPSYLQNHTLYQKCTRIRNTRPGLSAHCSMAAGASSGATSLLISLSTGQVPRSR